MGKKYLELADLKCYRMSYELANRIWELVITWKYFEKETIGKQMVRSTDSISANIAEGFGRYTKKDKILFYRYSYASAVETIDWTNKAHYRNLIDEETKLSINENIRKIKIEIHNLINFTNSRLAI